MARINHVALKVTDLEAATKFHENVFGVSRHLTDGYIDLCYESEKRARLKIQRGGHLPA